MEKIQYAVFGGGCFWCTEALFKNLKGVTSVTPGYAGGSVKNPSYDEVCMGNTGHAEVIKIEFDSSVIPYHDLVEIFMNTHNPTTPDRQGNDVGTQYRSIILYTDEIQKQTAEQVITSLENEKAFGGRKIVTEIKPFTEFYEAEQYHKDYYAKNKDQPYCQLIISPKLQHLREKYSNKLKT